uniref:Transcription repressor n=1 Tax=Anthurium amnicola TaxID=1678845 RepID=A0A1D1XZL7_9ARAE
MALELVSDNWASWPPASSPAGVASPRISFSRDLDSPTFDHHHYHHHRSDASLLDSASSPEFHFCVSRDHPDHDSSIADELFSDGFLLPLPLLPPRGGPIAAPPSHPNPTLATPTTTTTITTTTSWLLSACKYPKTPSFAGERRHPRGHGGGGHAATLSDVDRFLFENFNSLYTSRGAGGDDVDHGATAADECSSPPPPEDADPPPGVRASHRFFVSPRTSNSLLEDTRPSAASTSSSSSASTSSSTATVTQPPRRPVPDGGVPVMTFSKDPYEDFRRSMQEMVESRHVDPRGPLDWDFMEELLFCFLELNHRDVHKHVLAAFIDLAAALRRRWAPSGARRRIPAAAGTRGRRRRTRRQAEAAAAAERGGTVEWVTSPPRARLARPDPTRGCIY